MGAIVRENHWQMVCYFARKDAHFISHFSRRNLHIYCVLTFLLSFYRAFICAFFTMSDSPDNHRPTGNKNCPINGR